MALRPVGNGSAGGGSGPGDGGLTAADVQALIASSGGGGLSIGFGPEPVGDLYLGKTHLDLSTQKVYTAVHAIADDGGFFPNTTLVQSDWGRLDMASYSLAPLPENGIVESEDSYFSGYVTYGDDGWNSISGRHEAIYARLDQGLWDGSSDFSCEFESINFDKSSVQLSAAEVLQIVVMVELHGDMTVLGLPPEITSIILPQAVNLNVAISAGPVSSSLRTISVSGEALTSKIQAFDDMMRPEYAVYGFDSMNFFPALAINATPSIGQSDYFHLGFTQVRMFNFENPTFTLAAGADLDRPATKLKDAAHFATPHDHGRLNLRIEKNRATGFFGASEEAYGWMTDPDLEPGEVVGPPLAGWARRFEGNEYFTVIRPGIYQYSITLEARDGSAQGGAGGLPVVGARIVGSIGRGASQVYPIQHFDQYTDAYGRVTLSGTAFLGDGYYRVGIRLDPRTDHADNLPLAVVMGSVHPVLLPEQQYF